MDGTKFIAVTTVAEDFIGKEEELLKFGFRGTPISNPLPLGTVVTLPATGSEMNSGAVITHGEDKLPFFLTRELSRNSQYSTLNSHTHCRRFRWQTV